MIPLRRLWLGQGTVSLAEDLELLRLMRRSGCMGLLIGFESVQKETQNEVKKIKNLRIDFYEAMRRFHGEGFGILGSFVFGFDYENKDVFEQTLEFIMRSRMDGVQLRILTPYPGTRLYKRLLSEGRLFVRDWWLRGYPPDTLLYQPKGMTADELISGYARLNRQAYSFGAMIKRFFGMSPWKRTLLGCQVYAGVNLSTRKRYFKGLRNPQPFAGASNSIGIQPVSTMKTSRDTTVGASFSCRETEEIHDPDPEHSRNGLAWRTWPKAEGPLALQTGGRGDLFHRLLCRLLPAAQLPPLPRAGNAGYRFGPVDRFPACRFAAVSLALRICPPCSLAVGQQAGSGRLLPGIERTWPGGTRHLSLLADSDSPTGQRRLSAPHRHRQAGKRLPLAPCGFCRILGHLH